MSTGDTDRSRLVESLKRPSAYPLAAGRNLRVVHIPTHISDVFLVGEFAYKVKKPVNFGFCNFSSTELREKYCEREMALNRRLSSDVYLSLEPVNFDAASGSYNIGGIGERIDTALRMRRLRSEDELNQLLTKGTAGANDIERIARVLAKFHAEAPHAPSEYGTVAGVSGIVLGNLDRVAEHAPPELDHIAFADISAYADAFLSARASLITNRHAAGAPRMCHGDLHAGNIFLEENPGGDRNLTIIDCIEFNDNLACIDPAADLAFLSMDLKHHGHTDLADLLVTTYMDASGDSGILPLLSFYESYRAMVRCMAASISAKQSDPQQRRSNIAEANAYLDLACGIASQDRPQFLAITSGLTGTGKSAVAELVASQWKAVHLRTDAIRRELAGVGPTERTGADVQAGIYSKEMSQRTYAEMHRRANDALDAGESVIMDGTHLQQRFRRESLDIGRKRGVATAIIECRLDEPEAIKRLERRYASGTSESEGRPDVYEQQKPAWQPAAKHEADVVARISTGGGMEKLPEQVFAALWRGLLASH
jgi:aminoglycoside phosphotransferase family enzyme/predicted kinase